MQRFAILAVLAALAVPVGAQDGDRPRPDGTTLTVLSQDALIDLIENLGYESKDIGKGWNEIQVEAVSGTEKITFNVDFAVSGDTRQVWIVTYVSELPPVDELAARPLSRLLAANETLRPASFYIYSPAEGSPRLYLSVTLRNEGLRPVHVREAIETMKRSMAQTIDLWKDVQWSSAAPPGG